MFDDDQIAGWPPDVRGYTQFAGEGTADLLVDQISHFFQVFDDVIHRPNAWHSNLDIFTTWKNLARRFVPLFAGASDNTLLYLWNTGQFGPAGPSNPYRSPTYFAMFASRVLSGATVPIQTQICAQIGRNFATICDPHVLAGVSPCQAWCASANTQQYCLHAYRNESGVGVESGVCPCFYAAYGRVPASRIELDSFGNERGLRHNDGNWTFPVGPDGCGSPRVELPPDPPDLYDAIGDFNNFCDAARSRMVTALGLMWQHAPCSVIQLFIQDHIGFVGTNDPIRLAAQCVHGEWSGLVAPARGVACGASTGGGCQSGNDCPPSFACTMGVCTPTGAVTGCASDAQCNPGFFCVNHVCQYQLPAGGCGHSGDCPPGLRCCNDQCQATCPAPCASADDCASGQWCNNGTCNGGADLGGLLTIAAAIAGIGIAVFVIHDHLTKPR